ncbi:patatin-like phospholipase family protein [Actinoallomurus purpureus]|uniref:patatin-like phospholipase family protein n=1 Tax=Actinoallomurus purpureus TaxID=478114 RepID=UPI002093E855|nr:patatin-like phospholipase family protein [Actinoallomurus purpureus]MCO6003372.1 patatin-like phospholipase family protein [Actinoallomurus purpureus]
MTKTKALVLGPGGVVGTAWTAGLSVGLRRAGVDLTEADLIVGTSAGAIVGAMLATGRDLERLGSLPSPADSQASAPAVDPARLNEVFAVLGDRSLDPADARRRVGRIALASEVGDEEAHRSRMAALTGVGDWPERELLITTVDVETGERRVWARADGAPLVAAVAASCAMPGVYPPITVNGRRYMDGALAGGSNTDLADGAGVLVLVEPLAHLFPADVAAEVSRDVLRIVPDRATIEVFGPDLHDRAAWQASYEAGTRQAADAAERIRDAWQGGAGADAPRGPVRSM